MAEVTYKYALYRGLYVDWAIMLDAIEVAQPSVVATGRPRRRRRVERIDCCDSQIHRHRFDFSSSPTDRAGQREIIQEITAGDEAIVDAEYDRQMTLMSQDWPNRIRRWLRG